MTHNAKLVGFFILRECHFLLFVPLKCWTMEGTKIRGIQGDLGGKKKEPAKKVRFSIKCINAVTGVSIFQPKTNQELCTSRHIVEPCHRIELLSLTT